MAKVWNAGDHIPVDYINELEEKVEKLEGLYGSEKMEKAGDNNVSKDKG